MGNAFGGKIVGARVAVVDYDHGPQAVKLREAFDAIAVNIKTFTTDRVQRRVAGPRRCAHRQDRRRRDHSRAVLAPRLRAGRAATRPGRRQLRPVHLRLARVRDAVWWCTRSPPAHSAAPGQLHRPGDRRALSLRQLHEVSAARYHRPGHVYLGHDRRRHVIHRRQGARRARGLSCNSHHQARVGLRHEHGRRHQGRAGRHLPHGDRLADGRPGRHLPSRWRCWSCSA